MNNFIKTIFLILVAAFIICLGIFFYNTLTDLKTENSQNSAKNETQVTIK